MRITTSRKFKTFEKLKEAALYFKLMPIFIDFPLLLHSQKVLFIKNDGTWEF
jgi:hypothetical protein